MVECELDNAKDCASKPTRTFGTCHGQQKVLSLSSRKHTQEITLPKAVLTQELLLHAERCMRHDDVVREILLAESNLILDEDLCDTLAEVIEEMELWKWDDATGDFWSRLAKALQQGNNLSHVSRAVIAD